MGFKQQLMEKLESQLTESEQSLLPGGFQTLGKTMILKLKPKLREKKNLIAKTCLELYPFLDSVYLNLGKIEGEFRTPERIVHVVGKKNSVVRHKEHGVTYEFDFKKIMFSKGNLNERRHLASLVEKGEIIVDMFAGIGYFSLPIAVLSEAQHIYSIELNPTAYQYLVKNIQLNKVEQKITAIHGDAKNEVLKLSKAGIKADRVIMGVFPAPKEFISEALKLAKSEGTMFHFEGVVDEEEYLNLYEEFKQRADAEGYSCDLKSHRFVKSYGPHLYHVVLDILVSQKESK